MGCLVAAACVSAPEPEDAGARPAAVTPSAQAQAVTDTAPPALRAAYIAAVQADAPAIYHFRDTPQGLRADPTGAGLAVTLAGAGVRVLSRSRRWEASFASLSLGCPGATVEVTPTPPVLAGRRAEYRHGDVVEWYQHGPLGLEQGFDLARRPACSAAGEGRVELSMTLGGTVRPELADERTIRLRDAAGREVGRYAELFVRDAAGREIPASLDVRGDRIRILVDDRVATYPLVIDPLVWEVSEQLATSGAGALEQLGTSIVLSGDTALLGAPEATVGTVPGAGVVYVFGRVSGAWVEQQKLHAAYTPPALPVARRFGASLALSGDTAVIGAPHHAGINSSGRAYVFTRAGGTWTEQQALAPPAGLPHDEFGNAVALDGDTALIGAQRDDGHGTDAGAVYVFSRTGSLWSQVTKLFALDAAAGDTFGAAIAFSEQQALIGAPRHGTPFASAGAVYVMDRGGGVWLQIDKLTAPSVSVRQFGQAIAMDGDTAVIGAPGDLTLGPGVGAAYVYTRADGFWNQSQQLLPSGAAPEAFGAAVALLGDRLAVGAPLEGPADEGAAYFFERSGGLFTETGERTAPTPAQHFGAFIALGVDFALAGAPHTLAQQGAVYALHQVDLLADGQPCADDGACVSGHCVDGVCCDQPCGGDGSACQACSASRGAQADGTCTVLPSGTLCRDAASACDLAETCDGLSGECPPDALALAGTSCRASVGPCDAEEVCDGATLDCPPDLSAPAGTTCRFAVGPCDAEESCDGVTPDCPPDLLATAGTECRAATGACDVAEACDGLSGACPSDTFLSAGVACRPQVGPCDRAEACSGTSAECPPDVVRGAGTLCRAALGMCDLAEVCDGVGAACPTDVLATDGTACPGGTCEAGTCSSDGTGGAGGGVGGGDGDVDPSSVSGCACRLAEAPAPATSAERAALPALAALAIALRRSRRASRSKPARREPTAH
ncbi:hypothetical protein [Chondromyces crocatus]|nr:hypothetical protein [Chondromyces crocatus]